MDTTLARSLVALPPAFQPTREEWFGPTLQQILKRSQESLRWLRLGQEAVDRSQRVLRRPVLAFERDGCDRKRFIVAATTSPFMPGI